MKTTLPIALLSAALLPAMAAPSSAADEKLRPAQESRSAAPTGSAATQPAAEALARPVNPEAGQNPNLNLRPAQEGRGGAATGSTATAPAKTAGDAAGKNDAANRTAQEKKDKEMKDAKAAEEKARTEAAGKATDTRNPVAPAGGTGKGPGGEGSAAPKR